MTQPRGVVPSRDVNHRAINKDTLDFTPAPYAPAFSGGWWRMCPDQQKEETTNQGEGTGGPPSTGEANAVQGQ